MAVGFAAAGLGPATGLATDGRGRTLGAADPPLALIICCCRCLAATIALNRRTCSALRARSSARLIMLGAEAPPTMTELVPPGCFISKLLSGI